MITRHNYEEYFILYMDNELGSDERRMVEGFILQHPDLKEELDILLHYKMKPDTDVVFEGKDELMKINGESPILLSNYEEWLILYNDNELTLAQRKSVEEFMAANPVFKAEQELLMKTRVQPETIVFADKKSLYRKEEKVRRIAPVWWRAAAAVLIIALGVSAIIISGNKKSTVSNGVAITPGNAEKKITPSNPVNSDNNKPAIVNAQNTSVKQAVATTNNNIIKQNYSPSEKKDKNNLVIKNNKPELNDKMPFNTPLPEKKNDKAIAQIDNRPSNNLPLPENYPNLNPKKEDAIKTDIALHPTPEKIIPEGQMPQKADVTKITTVAYKEDNTNAEQLEEGSNNKKSRGLFRKLSRTLVKRSNASTKDDENDSKLLVGGFAFRLK
jgi:hypothetical protein